VGGHGRKRQEVWRPPLLHATAVRLIRKTDSPARLIQCISHRQRSAPGGARTRYGRPVPSSCRWPLQRPPGRRRCRRGPWVSRQRPAGPASCPSPASRSASGRRSPQSAWQLHDAAAACGRTLVLHGQEPLLQPSASPCEAAAPSGRPAPQAALAAAPSLPRQTIILPLLPAPPPAPCPPRLLTPSPPCT
jgi:hypothetical protein